MSTADGDRARPADPDRVPAASADVGGPEPRAASSAPTSDVAAVRACPFLAGADGGWRLETASRDHRCGAVSPPAPLGPEKQLRLCLVPAHTSCATYLAAITARTQRVGAAPVRRATRWGLARTTSVIEDPGGIGARLVAALLDRRRWPAIPAVLLVATLFALAISGFRGGTPATAGATATPEPPAATTTSRPTPRPTPGATVIPSPSPLPSPTPTAAPTTAATPQPSASFRTYRVRSGDTLGAIASRFGTTVKAISALNGITDPSRLQVGQLLLIP